MVQNINPFYSAITSIVSAIAGTFYDQLISYFSPLLSITNVNTYFQWVAWSVAILAGLVSAWNGLMTACERYRKNHPKE